MHAFRMRPLTGTRVGNVVTPAMPAGTDTLSLTDLHEMRSRNDERVSFQALHVETAREGDEGVALLEGSRRSHERPSTVAMRRARVVSLGRSN